LRNSSGQENYLAELYGQSHSGLYQIQEQMNQDGVGGMSLSFGEARILQFLIQTHNVKTVVEIGSLYGSSALAMGMALPKDGKIYCFEKSEDRARKIESHLKEHLTCKFEVHSGPADEALKKIENQGPFDMVFIDADKGGYFSYLQWAEAHTQKGSVIVGDNTFLFGALWGESKNSNVGAKQIDSMKKFNERLVDESLYHSLLVPTPEGMTVGIRKV
tara:strand:+ start:2678 stop:3328 length:651 start_codon:yes stop_codon:yes gene_type:complete